MKRCEGAFYSQTYPWAGRAHKDLIDEPAFNRIPNRCIYAEQNAVQSDVSDFRTPYISGITQDLMEICM